MTVCHHENLKFLGIDIVYIATEFLTLKYGLKRNVCVRERKREREENKQKE